MNVVNPRALLGLLAVIAAAAGPAQGQQALGPNVRQWVGPLYPDSAKAQGHADAARAMAMVDDNPLIRWEYRVWCVTGYHQVSNVGTNQFADPLPDPKRDLVSPNGFYYREFKDRMPAGGARFMDNAWYFGTDYVGAVVVRTPTGLVLFDAVTTPEDMQEQVIDEMIAAGLDPTQITHVFLGHRHQDHIGGVNLLKQRYAPNAVVVAGEPDAKWIAAQRDAIGKGTAPLPRGLGANPSASEIETARKRQMEALPEKVDIVVPAAEGVETGVKTVDVGGGVQVLAILNPGHTPGQISTIVPVTRNGQPHKLLIWSGNDMLSEAKQYAISADFARGVAERAGADTFINTHPYQSAIFHHLRRLQADPAADNPMVMGVDGVSRYLGIFAACQRAARQRFEDGTWKSWE